jgi:hypothetical protein
MVQTNTYTNIWNKYLPVIRILFKKTSSGEQNLNLNVSDFEKAGMGRKTGYKFFVKLKSGRVDNPVMNSPLASSLTALLLQDPVIRQLCNENEFDIAMNAKFQLSIKRISSEALAEQAAE